jgi:hypothetical protein
MKDRTKGTITTITIISCCDKKNIFFAFWERVAQSMVNVTTGRSSSVTVLYSYRKK